MTRPGLTTGPQHAIPSVHEVDCRLLMVSHIIYDHWRRAAEREGLTPAQFRFLKALQREDNVPMSRFPQVFPCTKSNVTGVVDSLEQKGLVARQPDAEDRRVVRIRLTDEGKRLVEKLPSSAELFADSPTACLSPAEQDQLCRLLRKIEQKAG